MSVEIIQVRYETLDAVAARIGRSAEQTEAVLRRLQGGLEPLHSGGWVGRGSQAFFHEMTAEVLPAMNRMLAALLEARTVTAEITAIMQAAEEEAAALFQRGQGGSASAALSDFQQTLAFFTQPKNWSRMVSGAIGLLEARDIWRGLKIIAGSTYPGQMIFKGSQAIKELAGLSPYLTHMKWNTGKLIGQMTTDAIGDTFNPSSTATFAGKKIPIGKALLAADILIDLKENVDQYQNADPDLKWEKVTVATAVDTVVGLGGTAIGTGVGTVVGGLIGSVFPGPGTLIGGKIGGAVGGILGSLATSWMEDQPWYDSRKDALVDYGAEQLDRGLDRAGEVLGQGVEQVERGIDNLVGGVTALFD